MNERKPCAHCGGRGVIHWHPHWDRGHQSCPACRGGSAADLRGAHDAGRKEPKVLASTPPQSARERTQG